MKKFLITFTLIFGLISSSFAFEWGGLLNNVTNGASSDFKTGTLNQSNGIFLWINSALTEDKALRFSAEGMYKYNLITTGKNAKFTNTVDLNLLKLSGSWKKNGNVFSFNAGRFIYSDKTGNVFSQLSDGFNISYNTYNWNVGFYGGYTGLLNRFTVAMSEMPKQQKNKEWYDLCYGYVPLMLDFTFTRVGRNSIGLQADYFIDVTGNKKDLAYGSFVMRGPIAKVGNYSVAATVGTEKFKNVMLRGKFDLSFFLGQYVMASVGADYASGSNKVFVPFKSVTARPIHNTVAALPVDVLAPRLTGMFAKDNLVVTLTEKFIMTFPNKFQVNGLDSSLGLIYNIFSDLQLGANIIAYTDFISKEANNFSGTLSVNFTF